MKKTLKDITAQIVDKQPKWFSKENRKFFGDLAYYGFQDSEGENWLIRKTNAWTDMFDGIKKPHYRINKVSKDFEIQELIDRDFATLYLAKQYIK